MASGDGPAGGHGKWSSPGVPHRGWTCVDIEDLEEPSEICGMCEKQEIRFVHEMSHPDYPENLRCGCVCAGHMEEDLIGAEQRDRKMRSHARRRKGWPDRRAWRRTRNGNLTIKADGFRVTIFERQGSWSGVVVRESDGREVWAKRQHPTARAAQAASYYALMLLDSAE